MTRSTNNVAAKARKDKILSLAKGFRGRSKNCYTIAKEKVEKALSYAYRDRKNRKRDFRALWIQRINAGVRQFGLTYSEFIDILTKNNILIDRKMLADLAVRESKSFESLVNFVKTKA